MVYLQFKSSNNNRNDRMETKKKMMTIKQGATNSSVVVKLSMLRPLLNSCKTMIYFSLKRLRLQRSKIRHR